MKILVIALLACFAVTACGKKGDLRTPPLPGEQQEKENEDTSS